MIRIVFVSGRTIFAALLLFLLLELLDLGGEEVEDETKIQKDNSVEEKMLEMRENQGMSDNLVKTTDSISPGIRRKPGERKIFWESKERGKEEEKNIFESEDFCWVTNPKTGSQVMEEGGPALLQSLQL